MKPSEINLAARAWSTASALILSGLFLGVDPKLATAAVFGLGVLAFGFTGLYSDPDPSG